VGVSIQAGSFRRTKPGSPGCEKGRGSPPESPKKGPSPKRKVWYRLGNGSIFRKKRGKLIPLSDAGVAGTLQSSAVERDGVKR